ncbi:MAG: choline-sulfatase [Gammaproteobacteria bacterium]|nr:choline-sulfatase [Gammaproteobacteria bacterium]
MKKEQPNVVIFMVDQLTAFALNAYGGSECKSPHLNNLASNSTVFENAYTPYPLCAPARFSMMTGQLPSRIGAYDNGAELPASVPTIAHHLRAAGYYTCLSGKMHFVGPDQYHGFEERLTTEIYPGDFSWTPSTRYGDISIDDERRKTAGVSTMDTVFDAGPQARSMQIDYDEDVAHCAIREIYRMARSEDPRPFFLTVSMTHPHDPYVITQEYWDLYADCDISPPRVDFIPPDERDPHSRSLYFHYGQDKVDLSESDYRNARQGYYGMVSYIDELFGRLQQALDNSGFADNTIICFTSDHGDMLGERGMWFKKTLYEPAIRVPMFISVPNQAASRIKSPASLVDILPTLLDLTGTPADLEITPGDGQSLVPVMQGEESIRPIFVEHLDGGTIAPRLMVREGNYKYVCSKAYPAQLYDLSADPDERENLSGMAEFKDLELTLHRRIEENWNLDTIDQEIMLNQASRRLVDAALSQGRQEIWDFQPRPQIHNTNYVRRGDAFPDVERKGYLPYRDK